MSDGSFRRSAPVARTCVRVLLLLGCGGLGLLGGPAAGEVRRFSLVVGSNVGDGVFAAPLRYADDDAVSLHELLLEAGFASALLVAPDADTARLHPLTAAVGEPTLERLTQAFEAQRSQMRAARAQGHEVEWLFFFSGHGEAEGGEGFLGLARGRLTRTHLHEALLARVEADRVHVVVDACKSALLVAGKGPGGRSVPLPFAFAAEPERPTHVGFVLSASGTRDSHEWERLQAGVFSYEVRSALRGGADADGDGRVSYAELGAFLETANRAIVSPSFRPEFTILPPRGSEGLGQSILSWAERPGLAADGALGHVYVERASGERLLDLHAVGVALARVFLPSERPLFVRTADGARELTIDEGAAALSARELRAQVETSRAKGALHLAFEQLFSAPFEPGAVERWQRAWRPPDFSALEARAAPTLAERARPVVASAALGAAALSAVSFTVAWQRGGAGDGLSQQARVARNREIAGLNTAGVVAASVAAAAAAIWVWPALGVSGPSGTSLTVAPSGDGAALLLQGRLP